jgi:hypothetical protein
MAQPGLVHAAKQPTDPASYREDTSKMTPDNRRSAQSWRRYAGRLLTYGDGPPASQRCPFTIAGLLLVSRWPPEGRRG